MRKAHCHLKSLSAYSQSRKHAEPKKSKEGDDAYEKRTWRSKLHVTEDGHVLIPNMSFKQAIETAASYLRMRIPGKGQSEYGKHFKSGVLILQPLVLPLKAEDVEYEDIFANSDGKRGSGKRVWRRFPIIHEWSGVVTYTIIDDAIPEDVFETHVRESGNFVGIGRFRAEKGGFKGRFGVEKVEWE